MSSCKRALGVAMTVVAALGLFINSIAVVQAALLAKGLSWTVVCIFAAPNGAFETHQRAEGDPLGSPSAR